MQQTNSRRQDLDRLESLAERYRCSDTGVPHWLCAVLRDAIDWNRKWLARTERLGMDSPLPMSEPPERLQRR